MTFDLHRPTSIPEALELLERHDGAHLMAGGTALVLLMKQGLLRPADVISLRGVGELRGIERRADGSLRIGAAVTHHEAERSDLVRAHCPALADAFARVATIRIRVQATVGGNVAHADPAQDPPPMLIALGATAVLEGRAGRREMPLEDLFVDVFETRIGAGELLSEILVPPPAAGTRATYVKFLPRTEDDYATVAIAAALRLDEDGRCAGARIALGAAGPVPLRARRVEEALRGARLTAVVVRDAAALAREDADPIGDARGSAAYKREQAAVWTERALRQLVAA